MASTADHVASLTRSFALVPPAAVPAIIDCVLASAPSLSSSQLFSTLLDALPKLIEDRSTEEASEVDSTISNTVTSYINALFHLIKDRRTGPDAMGLFIWRGIIPLLRSTSLNDKELLNQIEEMLCDAVPSCGSWDLMEETLVPFCLRSIGLCVGLIENDKRSIFQWSKDLHVHWRKYGLKDNQSLPLPIACRVLTSLLDAILKAKIPKTPQGFEELNFVDGFESLKYFAYKLIWDLSHMVVEMLSQSLEHRSCAIHLLLPSIFGAFAAIPSFEVSIQGLPCVLSRDIFSKRIWKCCLSLFSLGQLERLDSYGVLSLYFTFPFNVGEPQDIKGEQFDIRAEKEFWEEIRRGLVDKNATARKLSLYILKLSLVNQFSSPEHEDSPASGTEPTVNNVLNSCDRTLSGSGTKRGKWADKEAKSLGVGQVHNFADHDQWSGWERWKAFFLLYEMLEEYGTHLVEAAWTHQVDLLFQSGPCNTYVNYVSRDIDQIQMETSEGMFTWLTVLWERGFFHENPQVRCLIMQSFLSIDWESHRSYAKQVPERFILGPFIQGLNDVVHHKDFGLKGIYTSKTIQGATNFLHQFCCHFSKSGQVALLCRLASVVRQESFGRAGLMALAFCLSSIVCGIDGISEGKREHYVSNHNDIEQVESAPENCSSHNSSELLDVLGVVTERSKQHFNPKYRLQVCEQVIKAACAVIDSSEVPLDVLLHFFSTVPREFTDVGGPLRRIVQKWFSHRNDNSHADSFDTEVAILNGLCGFPAKFLEHRLSSSSTSFDDDDLNVWGLEAQRWARVFFLTITRVQHLEPILMFVKKYGTNICKYDTITDWLPVKFLIIIMSLVEELQRGKGSFFYSGANTKLEVEANGSLGQLSPEAVCIVYENFQSIFLSLWEELVQFAKSVCSVFWSNPVADDAEDLPGSIRGKLGGPSQRRLSCFKTTAALQAILSMKTAAGIFSWFIQLSEGACYNSLFSFLWNFSVEVILSPVYNSEAGAEIRLAAYEALVPVFKALSSSFSPLAFDVIRDSNKSLCSSKEDTPMLLDPLLFSFLQNINDLLANGVLTRSRRAILMNWKWLCLDSLLSIPYNVTECRGFYPSLYPLFSDSSLKNTFLDVVESLENAGEASALPMLRSVRLIIGLLGSGEMVSMETSFDSLNSQMMERLVHSSWILHVSCNKRRIASIAALLSSILHPSVFGNLGMHETDTVNKGPLKWFIEQLLDEGTKSPRTIRLAACHLTGLWFSHPRVIKYYIKELKLLSLYGSAAFDEDFEAELSENFEAKTEVSMLAQSPYSEFTEAFINTEMYARVSVAILFHKLADMVDSMQDEELNEDAAAAFHCGKMFLLELLDSVVNDKDLSKELYKKYSGVHRRKVRAWQMICVLSRFVDNDIVQQVTFLLHICLYRNNLPAVRQYLETFAIQIYLKFPALIGEQLIPIFRDYNMRPQALSSYVFIAANVIIHAGEVPAQLTHLNELLPPMIPLLTSHHHSLRGFTQVTVYHVLCKLLPIIEPSNLEDLPLERKCFENLKSYLAENVDCVRLRASMDSFFVSFDPKTTVTPAGIFNARNEASDFECVPVSLMEQVVTFLNDVREDLRYSMAKDIMTIKNESINANADCRKMEVPQNGAAESLISEFQRDPLMDFQKKVTLYKYERQLLNAEFNCFSGIEFPRSLVEMENEDLLLSETARSRGQAMKNLRESRKQFILVASLLDRIPNLAGLVRTCEVFKATGLAVADTSILHDKQFQLISVTADKWLPIIEVPVCSMKAFLEKKKHEGFSILGLEQTANSTPLDQFTFPTKTVLVLGREKEGIPVDIIHVLDACVEIPQFGIIRSLNVHVSGAIALWEYTRQQRCKPT